MTQVLIFGDSITYGAYDSELGGWVDRLKAFLFGKRSAEHYFVYNLGVSGDTTTEILERLEFETRQRVYENDFKNTVFVFSIGVNDSSWMQSKNNHRVLPEEFKENLNEIVKLAKKFSSKIAFIGAIPADESKTIPVPWATDISYKNYFIRQYNEITKSVCKDNKIPFLDLFEEFISTDYKKLLDDGLHPNSGGHKRIFELVKRFLIKNKLIDT